MNAVPRARLGKSGIEAGRLGLSGSFGLDEASTERAVFELGIDYFFVTERMRKLTSALKSLIAAGHRDRLVIASGANIPFGWSVRRAWEKTARNLGVERIDVFHLFWVQAHWYVTGNTWKEMQRLKEEGLVRALAISCHDRKMARRLVDELGLDVLMIRYNAAHRGAESEIFASLDPAERPGIVAYTATRWGKLLEPAKGLAPMSPPECYQFALSHSSVDVVLCGPRNWQELAEDAEGARAGAMPASRLEEVKRFGDAVRATATGKIGFGGV